MPNTELLIAFVVASAVFAYMPGPSMLYTAAQTIARGRSGGLLAAAGIHAGGYVHVLAATCGLAVLFDLVPALYVWLKIIGAGYLIWLGLQMAFSRPARRESDSPEVSAKSGLRAFADSAIVEILNPKTAIFYVAFLPQFTDPAAWLPVWGQLLLLGTLVNVMFSSADLICVLLAAKLSRLLLNSPAANRVMQRVGGAILVALGLNLGLER